MELYLQRAQKKVGGQARGLCKVVGALFWC